MNKRILITGAAKRIGKEMALSFFNRGWDIVIHYNSSKIEAEALADKMNSARGNSAIIAQANLDNADEVSKLVEKTLSKKFRIDALINNASTFYPTPIGTFSEDNWNALMGSNLKAPLFLIQSFHEELAKNKGFIYNKTTKDLLQNSNIPPSSGFLNILVNKGSISNKGIEAALKAKVQKVLRHTNNDKNLPKNIKYRIPKLMGYKDFDKRF